MTKEELERIKQAYYSGLKVQIWFNGHWEDFDIRDYSMYPEPFSENRQYRIVGSNYADIAEKRIEELKEQIEKMKCCGNCIYFDRDEPRYCNKGVFNAYICDKWRFAND